MPDQLSLIQQFVWQDYDQYPEFPKLAGFLEFWEANLDGPLYKVTVAHAKLLQPSDYRALAHLARDGRFH